MKDGRKCSNEKQQILLAAGMSFQKVFKLLRNLLTLHQIGQQAANRRGRGLRRQEGLTREQLAQVPGIRRTDLAGMENGRRPIGKNRAKRLARVLKIDERVLL
jgi:DNA-binding XRE family transcriptional regulator